MTYRAASFEAESLLSALGGLATNQPNPATAALYLVIEQFSDGPGIPEQSLRLAGCRNVVLALADDDYANPIAVWRIVLGEPAEDVTASFALMAGFLRMARHTICDLPDWILDTIPALAHPNEAHHEPGHA